MSVSQFEFATAARILFGVGSAEQVPPAAKALGRRPLLVTGSHPERSAALIEALGAQGLVPVPLAVQAEPTTTLVAEGTRLARESRCDLVIALGGGSALDAGKAIAAMAANPGELLEYLEIIGSGRSLTQTPLPLIALPTTAGTGAEATKNAVLASPEHKVKVSLRSSLMLPRLAVVDPVLSASAPPQVTASTGMDALTQLIEPFVSTRSNPMVRALAREGMARVSRSLRRAYAQGSDLEARADMALASLLSGISLANAGLGAAHGFAGPLGGKYNAPHGALCARLLPLTMDVNIRALRRRGPQGSGLDGYREVAQVLTGLPTATPEDGVRWVTDLGTELGIPPLRTYGLTPADFPALVEQSAVSSSMKGNPISLGKDEMTEILERAW
ncbi:MAG: iron-containing alcohol dehydrogenase [Anaerolineales bacterium]|jgi:alcohol dehydrogenase class IV